MRLKKVRRSAAVFALLAISACSKSTSDRLVGEWIEVGGEDILEFLDDGTVIVADGDMVATGTVENLDDGRIKIALGGALGSLAGPMVAKVEFDDDTVRFLMPNGKIDTYVPFDAKEIRKQLLDALASTARFKIAWAEFYSNAPSPPTSLEQLGVDWEPNGRGAELISDVLVAYPYGNMTFRLGGDTVYPSLEGATIHVSRSSARNAPTITWRCKMKGVPLKLMPDGCTVENSMW